MKMNTVAMNWRRVFFLHHPWSWKLSKGIVGSACSRPSLNFALTLVLLTPKLTVTQPQRYAPRSLVSLPFWCQYALSTRLNTYRSKTSKRCTALQIHYGSEVPTGLVERPMERTANGHRLPHVHFHCFQSHAWNEISWAQLKINTEFVWIFVSYKPMRAKNLPMHFPDFSWTFVDWATSAIPNMRVCRRSVAAISNVCWWSTTDSNDSTVISFICHPSSWPKPHCHFESVKPAIKKRGDEHSWEDEAFFSHIPVAG